MKVMYKAAATNCAKLKWPSLENSSSEDKDNWDEHLTTGKKGLSRSTVLSCWRP